MERRKFMIGIGSLAAGGAAAMGTGAFETQEANRQLRVKVKRDQNGAIQLLPIGDFAQEGGTNARTLSLKFDQQNDDALTEYGPQFRIGNKGGNAQPNEDFEVWITVELGNTVQSSENKGEDGNRIVALDTTGGKQLNNVTNSKPSNPEVLGQGNSVDVEVTVDTRGLKNHKPSVSYDGDDSNDDYVLIKQMTIHTERVTQT